MKTCILGLLLVGFAGLSSAQNDFALLTSDNDDISSPTTFKTKVHNESYLNIRRESDQNLALRIKTLQDLAANYDISEENIFTNNKNVTYSVVFESNENYIKAIYNHDGTILQSDEYYEDIRIPYSIGAEIAKTYPGWSFYKSHCTISYAKDATTNFTYTIELKNGNKTKTVTRSL